MPPRLNKRQQRELEELEALSAPTNVLEGSSDEELDNRPSGGSGGLGIFAAASLLAQESDAGEDDEGSDDAATGPVKKGRKGKKKKKKPASKPQPVIKDNEGSKTTKPEQTQTSEQALTPSERKALKKAKQKEKKKAETDDIDQALAELSIKLPTAQQNLSQHTTSKGHGLPDLLGVSLQHLDSEAELRKFFGSRVVQASKASSSSGGGAARRNVAALRSNLTRPQPTWWNASQREGLAIRPLVEDEIEQKLKTHHWQPVNEKWWTIEYSKRYKSMTREFLRTVMSGDPEGFWELIKRLPWHADTLLQLSEVYRHREEHAQAVDFVDRALFTYERSFIGAFNLTSGLNRLDFDRVENRPFYLAIHRQVVDLQRRGCVRTGFEFARLLYSLDPWTDPHGASLHLDYVAIKANMSQWLLDVYGIFEIRRDVHDSRLNPSLLPGWAYSHALALRMFEKDKEDHEASTTALAEAINDFPSVVPLLADKLDLSLPSLVRGHPECKIETDSVGLSYPEGVLHLLSHLYVQRAFQVWKDPEYTQWFNDTATSVFTSLPSPTSALPATSRRKTFLNLYESDTLRYSVYRHIMVLESNYRRLFSFIPKYVFDGRSLACDPLPPKTATSNYDDDAFFEGVPDLYNAFSRTRSRRERALDERRLAQMVPDVAFRQQLEGFFEGQGLVNQFPGGIVQFAQMLAQLQPAEVEALMLNGMLNDPQGAMDFAAFGLGAGDMPGQMPGEDMLGGFNDEGVGRINQQAELRQQGVNADGNDNNGEEGDGDEDEDEEEEEEEEEEDYSPMPRMIRNVLGRLWGGNARAAEESSSEEEQPPPPPPPPPPRRQAYDDDWDGVD